MSLRRVWVLVRHRLLIESDDGLAPRPGTALARSVLGELGDWSRLDLFVANMLGIKPPESKTRRRWESAQQARLKAMRAEWEAGRSSGV